MQKASQLKPSLCKIAIQKYPPFDESIRPICCPYCPPSLPPLSLPLISLRRHAKIENRKLVIRNWVYFFSRRSCLLANHPIQIFHHHSKMRPNEFEARQRKFQNSAQTQPRRACTVCLANRSHAQILKPR
jgi:hypothetical protein